VLTAELDRMEIEDFGSTPERLAEAIHRQLGERPGSVPIHAIARALDIVDIRELPCRNFEGALQTDRERDFGIILANSNSSAFRRRYTIAHELAHFLSGWHKPTDGSTFRCRQSDMTVAGGNMGHMRQEAEANRFAIELLAPAKLVAPHLNKHPDLEHVRAMSTQLEISKAAAARRYVELHRANLAVIFSANGRYLYSTRGVGFPWLAFRNGDDALRLPEPRQAHLSDFEEVDSAEWFGRQQEGTLWAQTLYQQDGHAITLLDLETVDAA